MNGWSVQRFWLSLLSKLNLAGFFFLLLQECLTVCLLNKQLLLYSLVLIDHLALDTIAGHRRRRGRKRDEWTTRVWHVEEAADF